MHKTSFVVRSFRVILTLALTSAVLPVQAAPPTPPAPPTPEVELFSGAFYENPHSASTEKFRPTPTEALDLPAQVNLVPWYVAPGGSDSNSCLSVGAPCATINGAIGKATAGDTVYVATGIYTSSTGSEVVVVDKDIMLSGGWDNGFATQTGMSTVGGDGARRGITANYLVIFTIENFVVQNGSAMFGGGISSNGQLTLNNSIVRNNISQSGGGGIFSSGDGALILNNSIINANTSLGVGGGIYTNFSYAILNNSTVNNNVSQSEGGGIFHSGNVSFMNLNNSSISGNTSQSNGGGISNHAYLTLNSITVSANTSQGDGGGIYNNGVVTALRNSILASNTASGNSSDCSGPLTSQGYNLIQTITGCTITTTSNLIGINPKLGSLQANGGSTLTHALLPGSPALNAANPAGCTDGSGNPLTTDQRGWPHIGRCDIGAYEYFASKQVTGSFKAGGVVTYTISLNNLGGTTALSDVALTDTLPISLTYMPGSFSATSGTGGENGGVITWTGSIITNTETLLTFSATVSPTLPIGSVVTNTAQINWNDITIQALAQFDTFLKVLLPLIRR